MNFSPKHLLHTIVTAVFMGVGFALGMTLVQLVLHAQR
jgi:hypothetical protein